MIDILLFRKMVAPVILQILFWPAAAASLYYSAWLIIRGNAIGWVPLIVGTLFVRVVFEGMLLMFRVYEKLCAIQTTLESQKESRLV